CIPFLGTPQKDGYRDVGAVEDECRASGLLNGPPWASRPPQVTELRSTAPPAVKPPDSQNDSFYHAPGEKQPSALGGPKVVGVCHFIALLRAVMKMPTAGVEFAAP